MKLVVFLVVACIAFGGCTSTHNLDTRNNARLETVSAQLADRPVSVFMLNGTVSHGRHLRIYRDSTFLIEQGNKREVAVATAEVHAIEAAVFHTPIVSRKRFAVGFVIGCTSAALTQLLEGEPARISDGEMILHTGAGIATGLLGNWALGTAKDDDHSVGRYILNDRQ